MEQTLMSVLPKDLKCLPGVGCTNFQSYPIAFQQWQHQSWYTLDESEWVFLADPHAQDSKSRLLHAFRFSYFGRPMVC